MIRQAVNSRNSFLVVGSLIVAGVVLALVPLYSQERFAVGGSGNAAAKETVKLLNEASRLSADDDQLRYRGAGGDSTVSIRAEFMEKTMTPGPSARKTAGLSPRPRPSADFWKGRFRPIFVKAVRIPTRPGAGDPITRRFVSMRKGGLLYRDDGGDWKRPTGLPRRFTAADYKGPELLRDVEDLWQNPRRPMHLLAVVKHHVLQSKDGGSTWTVMRKPRRVGGNYTAVSAYVSSSGRLIEIWLGTSVNGVYRLRVSGGRITRARGTKEARGLPHYKHNSSNWLFEEISGLVVDESGLVLATTRFQSALFIARRNGRSRLRFRKVSLPGKSKFAMIQSLAYGKGGAILGTDQGLWVVPMSASGSPGRVTLKQGSGSETFLGVYLPSYQGKFSVTFARDKVRSDLPRNLKAIYISPTTAKRKQRYAFRLMEKYGFNAAVIDVKDDFGRLVYGSKLPEAIAMGNGRQRAPIRQLVRDLKKKNIYVIARQVVFKDNRVFKYRRNRYAIRTRGGGVWVGKNADGTDNIERWTDTYSTWVHDYNVRVAREVLELGFDEVQFDYIRFPTDGGVGRGRWRHRRGDAYRSEALESFLRRARERISKPISIDIYGYNGIYRVSGIVGQDLVDMGEYVDVISPMHYSSHFGPRYLEHVSPRLNRTRELLLMGTARPVAMSRGRFSVRPWLQAFKMSVGRWGWGEPYMEAQIKGTRDGGASGYLWWGPLRLFYLPGRVHKRLDG